MAYIDITWVRANGEHVSVSGDVEALLGYTVEEVSAMDNSIGALVDPSTIPVVHSLRQGYPGSTLPIRLFLILRHKDGSKIHCRSTIICKYDKVGNLVEAWGATRQISPEEYQLQRWIDAAPRDILQLVCRLTEFCPVA